MRAARARRRGQLRRDRALVRPLRRDGPEASRAQEPLAPRSPPRLTLIRIRGTIDGSAQLEARVNCSRRVLPPRNLDLFVLLKALAPTYRRLRLVTRDLVRRARAGALARSELARSTVASRGAADVPICGGRRRRRRMTSTTRSRPVSPRLRLVACDRVQRTRASAARTRSAHSSRAPVPKPNSKIVARMDSLLIHILRVFAAFSRFGRAVKALVSGECLWATLHTYRRPQ